MLKRYLVMGLFGVIAAASYCVAAEPGWTKDSNKGCKVFNPAPEPGDSVTWSGSCKGGYASGHGMLQWFSNGTPGSSYEGQMSAGKRHGTGTYKWTNGSSYEGGWANDKFDGKGVYFASNGAIDYAVFAGGKYNGPGYRKNADGRTGVAFIAVNQKFVEQVPLINDVNGCLVSDMTHKEKHETLITFNNKSPRITYDYIWSGRCDNGIASGAGELKYDKDIFYGTFVNGAMSGYVSSNRPDYAGYIYYQKQYDYKEYNIVKTNTENLIIDVKTVLTSAPQKQLAYAKKLEVYEPSRASKIYEIIIQENTNTVESRISAYHKEFVDADSSYTLDAFIKSYSGKGRDPDKLIPKAKLKKVTVEKREQRERAEAARREREASRSSYSGSSSRASRSGEFSGMYSVNGPGFRTYHAACKDGGTAHANNNDGKADGAFWSFNSGKLNFTGGISIEEGLRRACASGDD